MCVCFSIKNYVLLWVTEHQRSLLFVIVCESVCFCVCFCVRMCVSVFVCLLVCVYFVVCVFSACVCLRVRLFVLFIV